MSNHSLSAQNLLATLPQVLQNDPDMAALASSIADILAKRKEEIRRVAIYSRIDELPEDLLDILAYDFKIDWWDYDYTIEQKRQIFRDSFFVHKRLGTVGAVKTAISAIYPNTTVQEWFEYRGEPYTFRLVIDATNFAVNTEKHRKALLLVEYYKNMRSVLDLLVYEIFPEPATLHAGSACSGSYMCETVCVTYNDSEENINGME